MSKYSETRRVKKNLPYTITAIGGPDELKAWKEDQKRKEEEWQAAKATKHERVIAMMENGDLLAKEFKKTQVTKDYERMQEDRKGLAAWIDNNKSATNMFGVDRTQKPTRFTRPPTLNWFEMVYDRFINWLISFKF